ncbi:MAG: V-type ATP synthase subunit D [Candidatus Omnitrophota bacterium]|nr:V-type ATP synthase subunit D [Candidatus Omnitrophota bacterium]
MDKIKLTKGELKRQRDALLQYLRYLPTLQLKKQQLQMEILHQLSLLGERVQNENVRCLSCEAWAGLLRADKNINISSWLKPKKVLVGLKNIAGVDLPVFEGVEFEAVDYDLFIYPLWVDSAIELLRKIVSLRQEIETIKKGIEILRQELRITAQRVNLFEKVKIPEAEEAIRLIKIYLGDQMANAVGRSKIAKRKISEATIYDAIAS